MTYKLFKLNFVTPLHIGTNRPGFENSAEILHSDSLFSALVNCWIQLYPDDIPLFFPEESDSLVIPFFNISSAFPYFRDTLFFPKPYLQLNIPQDIIEANPNLIKKLKSVTYVSQPIFEAAINNQELLFEDNWFDRSGKFADGQLFNKSESKSPFKMIDVPRVVIDRMTGETMPFNFTRIRFQKDAGLYFLAEFQDTEWEKRFTAVLRLLGDTGIGGDRSVGHGLFEIEEIRDLNINVPENSGYFMTLSLYHPTETEQRSINEKASYQIIERKGWVFSGNAKPLRRQTVRMFTEGSIFPGDIKQYGDTIRVLKKEPGLNLNHDVFRFGQALVVPFIKGRAGS